MSDTVGTTCDLTGGATVIFDIPYTEAADYDVTYLEYELFAKAVGG